MFRIRISFSNSSIVLGIVLLSNDIGLSDYTLSARARDKRESS